MLGMGFKNLLIDGAGLLQPPLALENKPGLKEDLQLGSRYGFQCFSANRPALGDVSFFHRLMK